MVSHSVIIQHYFGKNAIDVSLTKSQQKVKPASSLNKAIIICENSALDERSPETINSVHCGIEAGGSDCFSTTTDKASEAADKGISNSVCPQKESNNASIVEISLENAIVPCSMPAECSGESRTNVQLNDEIVQACTELQDNDHRTATVGNNNSELHSKTIHGSGEASSSSSSSWTNGFFAVQTLKRLSVLRQGQFGGTFWFASAKFDEETKHFALKVESKKKQHSKQGNSSNDSSKKPIEHMKREVEVMQELNPHPFIVDLIHSYQTDCSFFMVLELVQGEGGGSARDLWECIHKQNGSDNSAVWSNGISENRAKFYGLVIADTLAYMHSKHVIFRGLTPESVLMDKEGYPVLADFDLAKIVCYGHDDKTYTFCGIPNYLAPEIIQHEGHGFAVDHWALGVLIYEMLVGEHPFYFQGMDCTRLFAAICQEDFYPLPDRVSLDAFDVIDQLLQKDPLERLGTTIEEGEMGILTHEWFEDLDLNKIRRRQVQVP